MSPRSFLQLANSLEVGNFESRCFVGSSSDGCLIRTAQYIPGLPRVRILLVDKFSHNSVCGSVRRSSVSCRDASGSNCARDHLKHE